tara:strand:- start:3333 stop:3641 length:309 start_codon:yes stop_codon:yes gene_type:complete
MNYYIDLKNFQQVSNLLPGLISAFGIAKANKILSQSIDLQKMIGGNKTLPVLFVNTGGIALTSFNLLKKQLGISINGKKSILLIHPQNKSFQILTHFENLLI